MGPQSATLTLDIEGQHVTTQIDRQWPGGRHLQSDPRAGAARGQARALPSARGDRRHRRAGGSFGAAVGGGAVVHRQGRRSRYAGRVGQGLSRRAQQAHEQTQTGHRASRTAFIRPTSANRLRISRLKRRAAPRKEDAAFVISVHGFQSGSVWNPVNHSFVRNLFAFGAKLFAIASGRLPTHKQRGIQEMKIAACAGVDRVRDVCLLSNGSSAQAREAVECQWRAGSQLATSVNIAPHQERAQAHPGARAILASGRKRVARSRPPAGQQTQNAGLMRRISHRVVSVVLD